MNIHEGKGLVMGLKYLAQDHNIMNLVRLRSGIQPLKS